MHSTFFYGVTAATFPFALASMAKAIKLRWPATAAAASYTIVMVLLMWIVELFPATPKLGPIYQHITHMVSLAFPLLIIAPALAIDLVMRRAGDKFGVLLLAPLLGVVFLLAFVAAQWPFATFLVHSPLAQGPIFNADNFVYWMHPAYEALTRRFDPPIPGAWPLPARLAVIGGLATLSGGLGLRWGHWMTKVRR
jgi:hypothetical protein